MTGRLSGHLRTEWLLSAETFRCGLV